MASRDSGLAPALALRAGGAILTILLFAASLSAAQEAPAVNATSLLTPANWEETCTPEVFHSLTYHYRSCARKFFHYEDPGEDGFIFYKTSCFDILVAHQLDRAPCYVPNAFYTLLLFESLSCSLSCHLEKAVDENGRHTGQQAEARLSHSSSAPILLIDCLGSSY
jgi:hypothetical protein